ncbi:MAG: outer membrane protein [Halieaceae bacterium]|jgi:outer membrane protein
MNYAYPVHSTMRGSRFFVLLPLLLVVPMAAQALSGSRGLDPEDRSGNWSLGFAYTWQDSVYAGEDYRTDFMPTLTYTGERFFLNTTDLGWHIVDASDW